MAKLNIKGDLQVNGLEMTNASGWLAVNALEPQNFKIKGLELSNDGGWLKVAGLRAEQNLEVKGRAIFIQHHQPNAIHVGDLWIETPV